MDREKSATWIQHEKSATWKKCNMKKCNMEKVQHGNSRGAAKTREHLRWRTLQPCLTALAIIVSNLSILDVCGNPDYTSGNSAKWTKCNKTILQHAKSATGEECKTKRLQLVKVQHEIDQFIKRVQHEKKCNMKTLLHSKVQYSMVQYEKSATWKECNRKNV